MAKPDPQKQSAAESLEDLIKKFDMALWRLARARAEYQPESSYSPSFDVYSYPTLTSFSKLAKKLQELAPSTYLPNKEFREEYLDVSDRYDAWKKIEAGLLYKMDLEAEYSKDIQKLAVAVHEGFSSYVELGKDPKIYVSNYDLVHPGGYNTFWFFEVFIIDAKRGTILIQGSGSD